MGGFYLCKRTVISVFIERYLRLYELNSTEPPILLLLALF